MAQMISVLNEQLHGTFQGVRAEAFFDYEELLHCFLKKFPQWMKGEWWYFLRGSREASNIEFKLKIFEKDEDCLHELKFFIAEVMSSKFAGDSADELHYN